MRHRKAGVKLNRTASHRKAMFRNMVTSLFKYDRIKTTDAKAKELRGWADHLITLAKRGDLHARRQALAIVREKEVVHKLFSEATEKYGSVQGGYTRVVKLGRRPGDQASISMIELVIPEKPKKKKPAKKKTKTTVKKPAATKKPKTAVKAKAAAADTVAEEAPAADKKPSETEGSKTAEVQAEPEATAVDEATPVKADAEAKPSDDKAVEGEAVAEAAPQKEAKPAKAKKTKKKAADPESDKDTTE